MDHQTHQNAAGGRKQVELRTRTRENVAVYFHHVQDEEIKAFLPQKAKTEAEAIAEYEKTLLPGSASYGRCVYADGVYVGDVWIYCIGGEDPDAMLSYCIFDKALWGQGIASEAVRLFMAEVREKYALHTLGAFTFADNPASVKVLLRNGFREKEAFEEDGRQSKYFQADFA